jgi:hypothetical protein
VLGRLVARGKVVPGIDHVPGRTSGPAAAVSVPQQ